jgi:Carboxypeptidase regulatory-like domain
MKRPIVRASLAAVIFAGFAIAVAAQNGPTPIGTLEGTVLDAHGKPVPDATVTIQTSDGLHPHATHTDSSGHFQFARWATGQYDVRAYSNGVFSDWDKRLVIRSKKTTQVALKLPPSKE